MSNLPEVTQEVPELGFESPLSSRKATSPPVNSLLHLDVGLMSNDLSAPSTGPKLPPLDLELSVVACSPSEPRGEWGGFLRNEGGVLGYGLRVGATRLPAWK